MTKKDRDELKRLEAEATPGPWFSAGDDLDEDSDSPYVFTKIDPDLVGGNTEAVHVLFEADWGTKEDAALIVAARNAFPGILAENKRMRELLQGVYDWSVRPVDVLEKGIDMGDKEFGEVEKFLAEGIESFLAEPA